MGLHSPQPRLILVGCGKMGGALVRGVLTRYALVSSEQRIYVIDPAVPPQDLAQASCINWVNDPAQIAADFVPDMVVIAVKPQQIAATLPFYARYAPQCVFLSIAAGMTLADLEKILEISKNPTAIVRSMPNLPASVGHGVTALIANKHATELQRSMAGDFMRAVGNTVWLDNEAHMNAVTALSGSGPAYVFALCEAMAAAGESLGLPPNVATTLARQTIIGSGALLAESSESAATLRQNVTSPNGTTEAALKVLLAPNALMTLMHKTLQAAWFRANELSDTHHDKKQIQ